MRTHNLGVRRRKTLFDDITACQPREHPEIEENPLKTKLMLFITTVWIRDLAKHQEIRANPSGRHQLPTENRAHSVGKSHF